MAFQLDDTIGALSSAIGPAARGIVRVTGPDAAESIAGCFEPADEKLWRDATTATVHRGCCRLPEIGVSVTALAYFWPGVRSATGQPLVEIHLCGSPPLLNAVLARLFEQGVRPAGPGEFTLRSFLSGRVDLLQAEAILSVIDAPDDQALAVALRQLAGGISDLIVSARNELLDLLADLEAGLDFIEDDLQFVSQADVLRRLGTTIESVDRLLDRCQTRMHSAHRKRVVLAGLPNAGKSTLFNALVGRNAALVSPSAGTTRDYLRGEIDWQGVPIELIDTPGWESQAEGMMRDARDLGREQCNRADLVVWCTASNLTPPELIEDAETLAALDGQSASVLRVLTKADLAREPVDHNALHVCVLDGRGIDGLVVAGLSMFTKSGSAASDLSGTTSARCRESLVHARAGLLRALDASERCLGDEVIALELRETLDHFGRILGTVYADDVLGRIFSRFCIGK